MNTGMVKSRAANRYIEYFADNHPHQFPLRLLNLVMQPTQDAAGRAGMIILYKAGDNSGQVVPAPFIEASKKNRDRRRTLLVRE